MSSGNRSIPAAAGMMTAHTGGIVVIASLWAMGAGLAVWAATIPLRRRFAGQLASPVLIATFATLAAVFGAERSMFYASGDFRVALIVALAAGLIAALGAFAGAQSLAREKQSVTRALRSLGEGRLPAEGERRLHTELRSLRQQVDEAARCLHAAAARERSLETSRRELVAWVSHDLRTPLAGLRAMAEALEDGVADSPERYYKQIRVDVENLTAMVDDLFQLSRIEAGAVRAGTDRVDVNDLVSDCIASLESLGARADVRIDGRVQPGVVVIGDQRELNRALTNLVANAVRHTASAGRVGIVGRRCDDAIEIVVSDECGGLSPEVMARMFDVGYRAEGARTPSARSGITSGAGLGLAITRGIVEAHHGSVDVENVHATIDDDTHADGCAVTVRLPALPV